MSQEFDHRKPYSLLFVCTTIIDCLYDSAAHFKKKSCILCIVIIILHVRTRVDPTAVLILILINHYEIGLLRNMSSIQTLDYTSKRLLDKLLDKV